MIQGSQDRYVTMAQEDRSAPRARVPIPASLRPSGAKSVQTVVNDLSLSGFSAMAVSRMHVGTICWLTLPGLGSQQAEVVWWNNGVVGCAFRNLLSPVVLDSIMAQWQRDTSFRSIV
jgi:PilZ domain